MPPWKLTIDARCMGTGIGTYILNLLANLRSKETGFTVCAIAKGVDQQRLVPFCDEVRIVDVPIYGIREQWNIPQAAAGCDLLHVPHYNVPILHRGPLVVSIHDLIHLMDPSVSSLVKLYAKPMMALAVRKAKHVITVSEYSKSKIVERLGIDPSNISVIYNGVSPGFGLQDPDYAYAELSRRISIPRHYFLFIGNLKPHKNLIRLLEAFARWRRLDRGDHHLLIVGEDTRYKSLLIRERSRLGLDEEVSFFPRLPNDLIPKLYAAATALIMPSTLEGFGLPVIEAMASGTPVICSNATSLPEVAGDAAEYFDPYSVTEIVAAIERVVSSSDRQAILRKRGLSRASEFSWERSAREHCRLYRSVLNGGLEN